MSYCSIKLKASNSDERPISIRRNYSSDCNRQKEHLGEGGGGIWIVDLLQDHTVRQVVFIKFISEQKIRSRSNQTQIITIDGQ